MDDDELTRRVRAASLGDQDAWSWLVDRFGKLVWSVVRASGLNASDAADAYQLTWLRLLDRIGTVQDPSRLGGWLATTARNECRGLWRRSGRSLPMADDALDRVAGSAAAADESSLAAGRNEVLWQAFRRFRHWRRTRFRALSAQARRR